MNHVRFSAIRRQFQKDRRNKTGQMYHAIIDGWLFDTYLVHKIGYKFLHFYSPMTGDIKTVRLSQVQRIFTQGFYDKT